MSAGRVACDHAERAERVERQTTHHSVGGWYGMGRAGWGWGGDGVWRYADTCLLDSLSAATQRERNRWKDKLHTGGCYGMGMMGYEGRC